MNDRGVAGLKAGETGDDSYILGAGVRMEGLSWFFALCGFSFAIGAYVEIEKVKKENIKMRARITNLEDELYK